MIEFISSWTGGIVVSVIIATILEMILPEGNNKKYIKTVIGVYILFSIISPIITKVSGNNIDINTISEIENMLNKNTIEVASIDTSTSIEKIYITNLKQDIKTKIEEKGYIVNNINITAETKDENNYGKITQINLNISQQEQKETTITQINEIKIEITNSNSETKTQNTKIPNNIIKELKEYLGGIYNIEEKNIKINE